MASPVCGCTGCTELESSRCPWIVHTVPQKTVKKIHGGFTNYQDDYKVASDRWSKSLPRTLLLGLQHCRGHDVNGHSTYIFTTSWNTDNTVKRMFSRVASATIAITNSVDNRNGFSACVSTTSLSLSWPRLYRIKRPEDGGRCCSFSLFRRIAAVISSSTILKPSQKLDLLTLGRHSKTR